MKRKEKEEEERRRKVVIRHLPPSLSQSHLFSQFHHLLLLSFNWFCFRPPNSSHKNHRYSRAYIEFKSPADAGQFAHLFHGHLFVDDNGAQFKAIVEYAPSQRVPKPSPVKDGREGTIYTDPDYLEFLKLIAKPVDNLPSASVQFQIEDAAQSGLLIFSLYIHFLFHFHTLPGAAKEPPITTPLMEFVRQKRAAEDGNQGSLVAVKGSKRAGSASVIKPGSSANKRGAEKKKYILKNSRKNSNQKDKSTSIMDSRQRDEHATLSRKVSSEIRSDSGKKNILSLIGKNCEISAVSGGMLQQPGDSPVSTAPKRSQRLRASEMIIKSILLNNETHQSQSLNATQHRHETQNLIVEHGKKWPRPMNKQVAINGHVPGSEPSGPIYDGDTKRNNSKFLTKGRYSVGSASAKQQKCIKDRPDPGVWAPLCHSVVQSDNEEKLSSTLLQHSGMNSKVIDGETKSGMHYLSHTVEPTGRSSRNSSSSVDIGSHKHFGHNVAAQRMKGDGSRIASEHKSSKRGGASGYGVQKKQVWVQKSASGS
ncbi:regulator of nonsense transcripts UPF3 isoform X2 [Ricinus communis]|uniref:regulator of nonsense transcripts UPF3 isoform X2 n=1 Tax=Ricinus communis TaxID=3988 RepID=UPI00201B0F4B|nr:regulator of nonsense transcripts UPF3 isoform X2 [Ricinus communis]